MVAVLTVLFATGHAMVVQEWHIGCDTSPGSPPCGKMYGRSDDVEKSPRPLLHALPTPNPAGQLVPGCTCAVPELHDPPAREEVVHKVPTYLPGEVEVLTVDVRLANRVRCDNVSLADDVAKMLNIPVERVAVTPWSWTPGVAQDNYLAFVQQDHDRCDCMGVDGQVARGQGFKKVHTDDAEDGWMLGADTSVMTVSQYKAFRVASEKLDLPKSSSTPEGPPPARVQMLTRDPCLVHLLRSDTDRFRKRIAYLLGLPENKVVVDPPLVKGTVGLMQVETSGHSTKRMHQVTVLAVQHCNAGDLSKLEGNLPFGSLSQADISKDFASGQNVSRSTEMNSNQTNRAWIAFWNIAVLPPFAVDGAWKLLNMVNMPKTELSKLLPMTLARVPGLKYRGLEGPNALNETRLPPPEDKAANFQLERHGVDDESMRKPDVVESFPATKAQEVLQDGQHTAAMIKSVHAKFADAAKAHAMAIHAPRRVILSQRHR